MSKVEGVYSKVDAFGIFSDAVLSCDQSMYSNHLNLISIYTLSDLGDLSNLIGSLSRTIQQYSPPSEWIMCELGFFPIFLEKDLLKVDKILGLTFFRARKDFEGLKTAFIHLLLLSFVVDHDCLQLPFIRLEEAVS